MIGLFPKHFALTTHRITNRGAMAIHGTTTAGKLRSLADFCNGMNLPREDVAACLAGAAALDEVAPLRAERDAMQRRAESAEADWQALAGELQASRDRVCANFRKRTPDGCACPYCTNDTEAIYEHAANLELDEHSAQTKLVALRARVAQLEAAIRWALGEVGEFPAEEPPLITGKYRQRYHWRTELRKRAVLTPGGPMSAQTLECPCCGDDGALADANGEFYDGQTLVCGCPGWVSVDEDDVWINNGDSPCPKGCP